MMCGGAGIAAAGLMLIRAKVPAQEPLREGAAMQEAPP